MPGLGLGIGPSFLRNSGWSPQELFVDLQSGNGSYVATEDDVLSTVDGDFEWQMRVRCSDEGGGNRAFMGTPNPWTFWFALRTSTDNLEIQNEGDGDAGGKAIISGWDNYDEDVSLRIVRAEGVYTAYVRTDDADDWTELGSDETTAVGDSTTDTVYLGATNNDGEDGWAGRIYYARMWADGDASDGTLVFDMDPSRDASLGATEWVSSTTGETWTVGSAASIEEVSDS